jgi:hypothetical protein
MIRLKLPNGNESLLKIDYEHVRSSYGFGVVVDNAGTVFGGDQFRRVRELAGAWIETDDSRAVCAAMGIPANEPGIKEVN